MLIIQILEELQIKNKPIEAGGRDNYYLDSITPNQNNLHHFAAYLLASILKGPNFAINLDKLLDFYNKGDQHMAELAAAASISDAFWYNPSFWIDLCGKKKVNDE